MTGLCGCAASIRAEVWLGAQSESPLSRVDAGRRVVRLLQRRGVLEQGNVDPLWEQEPLLATITAASVQGQIAIGERAGQRVRRRLADPEEGIRTGPLCFASRGFSLHAAPPGRRPAADVGGRNKSSTSPTTPRLPEAVTPHLKVTADLKSTAGGKGLVCPRRTVGRCQPSHPAPDLHHRRHRTHPTGFSGLHAALSH